MTATDILPLILEAEFAIERGELGMSPSAG